MAMFRHLIASLFIILPALSPAIAGDFDWLKELNIRATADSRDFKATLSTRFKVGDAEINAVFSNVDRPADAYMVLRLGELSHRSTGEVLEHYHASTNRGWGALAKSLGIKPGSREFHALKAGHDLSMSGSGHHPASKHPGKQGKGANHNKGKGKHK